MPWSPAVADHSAEPVVHTSLSFNHLFTLLQAIASIQSTAEEVRHIRSSNRQLQQANYELSQERSVLAEQLDGLQADLSSKEAEVKWVASCCAGDVALEYSAIWHLPIFIRPGDTALQLLCLLGSK